MPLTSRLKDLSSPISQFLSQHFPNTAPLLGEMRSKLKGTETIRPDGKVPYGTLGTALDYRLRYYFAVTPSDKLVAWNGAASLSDEVIWIPLPSPDGTETEDAIGLIAAPEGPSLPFHLIKGFFASLDEVLQRLAPARRRLEPAGEELLAQYCIVLALFEEVVRAGTRINSPLFQRKLEQPGDLLAIAERTWREDLCRLSWAFHDTFGELLSHPAVLNPTFGGSQDVGGADADLILDKCLIDIKTSVTLEIKKLWLYQLLGYVLLDYEDTHGLSGVGLYMTRQVTLVQWPLDRFLSTMAGDAGVSLIDMRRQFKVVAQSTRLERCAEDGKRGK